MRFNTTRFNQMSSTTHELSLKANAASYIKIDGYVEQSFPLRTNSSTAVTYGAVKVAALKLSNNAVSNVRLKALTEAPTGLTAASVSKSKFVISNTANANLSVDTSATFNSKVYADRYTVVKAADISTVTFGIEKLQSFPLKAAAVSGLSTTASKEAVVNAPMDVGVSLRVAVEAAATYGLHTASTSAFKLGSTETIKTISPSQRLHGGFSGFNTLPFNRQTMREFITKGPFVAKTKHNINIVVDSMSMLKTSSATKFLGSVATTAVVSLKASAIAAFKVLPERVRTFKLVTASETEFMIRPLPTFTDAINSDVREFGTEVDIYTKDGILTLLDHDIESWRLLEEIKADTNNPIGDVSANEFVLGLNNWDKKWSPANKDSELYGLLVPGIKVVPRIKILLAEDEWISFDLGTFYSGDWNAFSGSVVADVVCYDRLYAILNLPFSGSEVIHNTTIGDLFESVVQHAGIGKGEYRIDAELYDIKVKRAHLKKGTIGNVLSELSEASSCYVRMDRKNVLQVHVPDYGAHYQASFNQDNQIITSNIPTKYLGTYANITVPLHIPYNEEPSEVLRLENVPLIRGVNEINGAALSSDWVDKITDVKVSSDNATVTAFNIRGSEMDMVIYANRPLTVDITANGYRTEFSAINKKSSNAAMKELVGNNELLISNNLIQDEGYIPDIFKRMEKIVYNPRAMTSLNIRGNPAINLGGIVEAEDTGKLVVKRRILVTRVVLEYAKSLKSTLDGYEV